MLARTGIGSVTLVIFLLNLPFGYWRVQTRRFTLPWCLAIHLPIRRGGPRNRSGSTTRRGRRPG